MKKIKKSWAFYGETFDGEKVVDTSAFLFFGTEEEAKIEADKNRINHNLKICYPVEETIQLPKKEK